MSLRSWHVKEMGLSDAGYPTDIERVFQRYRIKVLKTDLTDAKIRAVSICGEGLRPSVVVNTTCKHNGTEPGLRFTLAHELCHLLFDQEEGVPLAVASGPWAPGDIEKRANAFAAMFLMPAEAARRLLHENASRGVLSRETISAIALAFVTGKLATLRHLGNLHLIDEDDVELLEEQLTGAP
jgi:Zn-dependent peptidase ImmA (M78 family)